MNEISHCGTFTHLGIGRVGDDEAGKGPDIQLLADGQCPGGDAFAGTGADDRHAEDLAGAVGDDLDVAVGRMLHLGAVVLAIGPAQDADDTALHPGLLLEKADLGQFGIGISYRGHGRWSTLNGTRNSTWRITRPAW